MQISVRDVPALVVVTESRDVDQAGLEKWLPEAMADVHRGAGDAAAGTAELAYLERGAFDDEPVFVAIYEGDPHEGPVTVEVCAPLRADAAAPAGVPVRTVPAHREAYVRVTKETVVTGGLGEVYAAIDRWITANGYAIVAAPRETYWTDFPSAAMDDVVFDVGFPIAFS
ncbi:GyrI-like domain-containing protein [Hamadaea tsunoensis]|uniref:GyrI-like domain-containing protein n=1 Tax=Hamadaea tsunoensis TaxID=53368 RepID=UPI0006853DF3|nr:GyrI-like domain-containing protein [Hamadaea tsunoensis]